MVLTASDMIDAIKESKGFVTKAADLCHVARSTFYKYLERFPTAQRALDDVREGRHDFVENKLLEAIEKGNVTAMIFYLKTQCKDRGYVERVQQEHTGANGGPMEAVSMTMAQWKATQAERRAKADETLEQFADDE